MKKGLIAILFALIAFVGCQDDTSILAPEIESDSEILTELNKKPASDVSLDYTKFKSKYSKTYTVDGDKGGKIYTAYSWVNEFGEKIRMAAILTIPVGAYSGELTFDMIFDMENLSVELHPTPFTFDIPVILDLGFGGVDLTKLDKNLLEFDYLDGEKENLDYKRKRIDVNKGILIIEGAQIPHFSRYGWTRTK